ncbi:hypothetical protein ACKVMH_02875 [Lysobacter zhanggongensis]|uniref:Uncharacterized protein n=1 Tax=Lysobacter zhanggongensis TaxID=1774951 RepID=A0ABU7YMT7_9GAMM
MIAFDYAAAKFIQSDDGQWRLDRNWTAHPATQLEVEALFAHTVRQNRMLAAPVSSVTAGELVVADGHDTSATANITHYLSAVGHIAGSVPAGVVE